MLYSYIVTIINIGFHTNKKITNKSCIPERIAVGFRVVVVVIIIIVVVVVDQMKFGSTFGLVVVL